MEKPIQVLNSPKQREPRAATSWDFPTKRDGVSALHGWSCISPAQKGVASSDGYPRAATGQWVTVSAPACRPQCGTSSTKEFAAQCLVSCGLQDLGDHMLSNQAGHSP